MINILNSGIYQILNKINNKIYIGSAVDLKQRKNSHFNTLDKNKHWNKYLQRSYNKYGKENFKFQILLYCNKKEKENKQGVSILNILSNSRGIDMSIDHSDFFIAIYTNECKKYCDQEFFASLISSNIKNAQVEIVDNSIDLNYSKRLSEITSYPIHHINVDRTDSKTLFLRNVFESIDKLRELFLRSRCKYFITLESDVIPPLGWLNYFLEGVHKADVIGGIYYPGFHDDDMFENPNIFQSTNHVLSGCTLYKRKVIEKIPFRWDKNNLNAFPDALISYDAIRNRNKFILVNYSKIKCRHLTKQGSDSRGLEDLR
ncbi:MAG: GIY-YIG nuclease family protein [Promethearchaeota archaeon]